MKMRARKRAASVAIGKLPRELFVWYPEVDGLHMVRRSNKANVVSGGPTSYVRRGSHFSAEVRL